MGNAWKKTHRDLAIIQSKKWRRENPIKHLLIAAKFHAKLQGVPFDIKAEDIHKPTHCPVFGIELKYYGQCGPHALDAASLDRKNPKNGYVAGNVVVVSFKANNLKGRTTPEELRALADFYAPR